MITTFSVRKGEIMERNLKHLSMLGARGIFHLVCLMVIGGLPFISAPDLMAQEPAAESRLKKSIPWLAQSDSDEWVRYEVAPDPNAKGPVDMGMPVPVGTVSSPPPTSAPPPPTEPPSTTKVAKPPEQPPVPPSGPVGEPGTTVTEGPPPVEPPEGTAGEPAVVTGETPSEADIAMAAEKARREIEMRKWHEDAKDARLKSKSQAWQLRQRKDLDQEFSGTAKRSIDHERLRGQAASIGDAIRRMAPEKVLHPPYSTDEVNRLNTPSGVPLAVVTKEQAKRNPEAAKETIKSACGGTTREPFAKYLADIARLIGNLLHPSEDYNKDGKIDDVDSRVFWHIAFNDLPLEMALRLSSESGTNSVSSDSGPIDPLQSLVDHLQPIVVLCGTATAPQPEETKTATNLFDDFPPEVISALENMKLSWPEFTLMGDLDADGRRDPIYSMPEGLKVFIDPHLVGPWDIRNWDVDLFGEPMPPADFPAFTPKQVFILRF